MSLSNIFGLDVLNAPMNDSDLIQQIASLAWLYGGEEGKDICGKITSYRVASEIWQRLSGEREIEAARAECILGIVDYIQKHPKASEAELTKEVTRHIQIFAEKVEGR